MHERVVAARRQHVGLSSMYDSQQRIGLRLPWLRLARRGKRGAGQSVAPTQVLGYAAARNLRATLHNRHQPSVRCLEFILKVRLHE